MTGDSKYVDVLERSMYNGALAGISLAGDHFFYVNPLASNGDHHRQEWYGCACCPSQICRFLPSIGNYIYGTSGDAVWVNLYIGGEADVEKGLTLTQETRYPWEGDVKITVGGKLKKALKLRIPGWCKEYSISVNGKKAEPVMDKGYAVLDRKWKDGDVIELSMNMPVEVIAADPRVKEDEGLRAIQRGPLVYCMEEADNPEGFDELNISPSAAFEATFQPDLLCGVETIKAVNGDQVLNFIPYYAWDNRTAGKMKVWVPYSE